MSDDLEEQKKRARISSGVAQMNRVHGGWKRLMECIEQAGMTDKQALGGLMLLIEAILKYGPEVAQRKFNELILSAADRAELERLRELVPELERRLTSATQVVENQTARIAELKELLEAAQAEEAARPKTEPVAKPGRKCPSVAPSARTGDPVEDWRLEIANFFLGKSFDANAPRPTITAEELKAGRAPKVGRELIYRPSGLLVPTDKMMVAFGLKGHFILRPEEQGRVGFSPADQGYWFWGEVDESAPRRGGSFNDFVEAAPKGWTIMSLEEYFLTRLVMEAFCGVILDVDEPVCLRTTYATKSGAHEVLYAQSHVGKDGSVELIVRSISPDTGVPSLGARYRELVPSVRLPE